MTATDPIVIVGAARTPMGAFLGDLKDAAAPRARRSRNCGRGRAGRDPRRRDRRSSDGLCAARGTGSGAGAAGDDRRRPVGGDGLRHGQ